MDHLKHVTASDAARCLWILEEASEPLVAVDIAARMNLGGTRESRRRQVRAIVHNLRESGSMIVATLTGGYWLTEDVETWRRWNEDRQIDAKQIIGESHRRQKQAAEAGSGQGMLFNLSPQMGAC